MKKFHCNNWTYQSSFFYLNFSFTEFYSNAIHHYAWNFSTDYFACLWNKQNKYDSYGSQMTYNSSPTRPLGRMQDTENACVIQVHC